jgi:putative mRNA 3-end processing factor
VGDLIVPDRAGLACPLGGFHIDPWGAATVAVVTHAHGDHARPGSERYLCAAPGAEVLRKRLPGAAVEGVEYGERVRLGEVTVSLHPAGHVLGSAQVRVESGDSVWVVSGDYKRQSDPTCAAFESVACDVFVTEATFGLPIYRWPEPSAVAREIVEWWDANAAAGRASVLFGYALGKCQRVMAELALLTKRAVWTHGAVEAMAAAYRQAGVRMVESRKVGDEGDEGKEGRWDEVGRKRSFVGELIVAPPSAAGSVWMRRFGEYETGFASGWMRVRGIRRRMGYDRGFVMSDHADWDDLIRTVRECGARRVLATHGYAEQLARHLREAEGVEAGVVETPWKAEEEE